MHKIHTEVSVSRRGDGVFFKVAITDRKICDKEIVFKCKGSIANQRRVYLSGNVAMFASIHKKVEEFTFRDETGNLILVSNIEVDNSGIIVSLLPIRIAADEKKIRDRGVLSIEEVFRVGCSISFKVINQTLIRVYLDYVGVEVIATRNLIVNRNITFGMLVGLLKCDPLNVGDWFIFTPEVIRQVDYKINQNQGCVKIESDYDIPLWWIFPDEIDYISFFTVDSIENMLFERKHKVVESVQDELFFEELNIEDKIDIILMNFEDDVKMDLRVAEIEYDGVNVSDKIEDVVKYNSSNKDSVQDYVMKNDITGLLGRQSEELMEKEIVIEGEIAKVKYTEIFVDSTKIRDEIVRYSSFFDSQQNFDYIGFFGPYLDVYKHIKGETHGTAISIYKMGIRMDDDYGKEIGNFMMQEWVAIPLSNRKSSNVYLFRYPLRYVVSDVFNDFMRWNKHRVKRYSVYMVYFDADDVDKEVWVCGYGSSLTRSEVRFPCSQVNQEVVNYGNNWLIVRRNFFGRYGFVQKGKSTIFTSKRVDKNSVSFNERYNQVLSLRAFIVSLLLFIKTEWEKKEFALLVNQAVFEHRDRRGIFGRSEFVVQNEDHCLIRYKH